jgi:N-acetylmuramate 1-kinase
MMFEDLRTLAMRDWLEHDLLLTITDCKPASSDASFRRYFRISTPERTYVVMDAPPPKENVEPFMKVADLLADSHVNVPGIYGHNVAEGFLLLEDFGSQSFLDQLDNHSADTLYNKACDSLFSLQAHTHVATAPLPRYDQALLMRELGIFKEWYIGELHGTHIPDALWQTIQDLLITSALEQPVVCVHRDFHSRNLMVTEAACPGILDFQDAVIGPITYDLVSLLRDCYIAWPDSKVDAWMMAYYQRLVNVGLLVHCPPAKFKRWFDLMGMQRHLKAIGIFARLHLRDGKSNYLTDIPRTLNYVATVSQQYRELAEFSRYISIHLLNSPVPA